MRTKLIAGNWKMNNTAAQAAALVQALSERAVSRADVDIVVCPPYLALPKVKEVLRDSPIHLGAQDCFWESSGAFTGKVSASMLAEFCVSYCIVGHSESRGKFGKLEVPESTLSFFGESDETVNLKIRALLFQAIVPIVCVGETLQERASGQTDSIVEAQVRNGLRGLDPTEITFVVIAYEPVWAIGTGETCDAAEANRVCGQIRSTVLEISDEDVAGDLRVLYGGSVKAANAKELFDQEEIDGALVGGASLDAAEFSKIVMSA